MTTLVVGGTGSIGAAIARRRVDDGRSVIVTGRDLQRTEATCQTLGARATARVLDLERPASLGASLRDLPPLDAVVVTAIDRTDVSLADFDIASARRGLTVKLLGTLELVRVVLPHLRPDASLVMFGGLARRLPYPGSTVVTVTNGAVSSMVKTLAFELAPHRVNAVHPGIVADSEQWRGRATTHPHAARTPGHRLVAVADVVDAVEFLLRNRGMNAQDICVDGGIEIS